MIQINIARARIIVSLSRFRWYLNTCCSKTLDSEQVWCEHITPFYSNHLYGRNIRAIIIFLEARRNKNAYHTSFDFTIVIRVTLFEYYKFNINKLKVNWLISRLIIYIYIYTKGWCRNNIAESLKRTNEYHEFLSISRE